MIVEFKARLEYVFHPGNRQWEKEYSAEQIEYDCPSYDTAEAYLREWEEIWQDYLNEQKQAVKQVP